MKRSFERRVRLGLGLVSFLLALAYVVSLQNSDEFRRNSRQASQAREVLRMLDLIRLTMTESQAAARGFLLTGDPGSLSSHETARATVGEQMNRLERELGGNPMQAERLKALRKAVIGQLESQDAILAGSTRGGRGSSQELPEDAAGERWLAKVRDAVEAIAADEQRLLALRDAAREAADSDALGIQLLLAVMGSGFLFAGYRFIQRYINERRRWQEQVEDLNRQLGLRASALEAANKELEAFSYSVSHDLRAPLRHIAGFADLLEKHLGAGLQSAPRRYLTTIRESTSRMGTLIDDLLVFSRMGRSEMRRQPVNLGALAGECIELCQRGAQGRRIEWNQGPLPEVLGDPAMLRQVLLNLLDNAVKYTRQREVATIEIGCSQSTPGEVSVFVRDNGVGFDMRYVDKLFGVFQRLHRNEEFEGTGIGLANVRRIILRHGGRTWAEGRPGEGATIYFSLPSGSRN
jgi:signal transduction histidine kinase